MTAKKHSFEGYAVRLARNNYQFRCYVSASARDPKFADMNQPKRTYRRAIALENSRVKRSELIEILNQKNSWRAGALTKKALTQIKQLGFTVEIPEPAFA